MPAKNISFNTPNHAKFTALIKATGKPTRQAAIADVLRKVDNNGYIRASNKNLESLIRNLTESRNKCRKENKILRENITLYRTAVVVMAFIAVTGWVL